jgi:hypothetical protein
MATDLKDPEVTPAPSATSLVAGIIGDAEDLFQQQFAMFKHEVRDDFRKTKQASYVLLLGGGLGLVGAILLVQMLAYLTQWFVPDLPLWACFGAWGVWISLAGAVVIYVGKAALDACTLLPEKSAQALKENVQWITKPK